MDSSNNPDFIIQPAQDVHGSKGQGQSTVHGQGPGGTPGGGPGGGGGPSLIVSNMGLSSITSSAAHGHGQVGLHYSGSAISATPIQANIQPKSSQSYVMTGGPAGQSLIVPSGAVIPSGPGGLTSISAVNSNPNVTPAHAPSHYGAPIGGTSMQPNLAPKGTAPQSYVMTGNSMQTGVGVPGGDSGDEGVPVSIHVSNNPMGSSHDAGPGSNSSDAHQSGQSEQRLKVEDALNYLDQVKYKFGNQPQVYNDFLDIMKEFKSQSIDTPGVISRVSNLFRGHPELIVGFNTFLPPGYKIEVQNHDSGSQISYRVDGVTNYILAMPSNPPSTHPPVAQGSSGTTQIIQPATHGGTIKNVVVPHTIQPGPAPTAPVYRETSAVAQNFVNPSIMSVGVGVPNGRSVSPVGQAPSLAPTSNTYEGNAPAFTHSFSSPFVHQFPSLTSQPVEFNHAINYVNKIKNRFSGQPDKYKQFLEILHTYQKEQRNLKEGLPPSSKHLTEVEVYAQVAKLFENQEDLLQEFGQFLPDATNHSSVMSEDIKPIVEPPKKVVKPPVHEYSAPSVQPTNSRPTLNTQPVPKRPSVAPAHSLAKKPKLSAPYKDVSFSEAARYGTLHDFAFFDKFKSSLKSQEIFDNFLRCLVMYNEEIISRQELVTIVTPFFNKAPELLHWFKEFCLKARDEATPGHEPTSQHAIKHEKMITEEQIIEIDFSTCKRLGASYCALPKNNIPPICSGRDNDRTNLCKEVLNDVWVSFPTWSEDSTFVTSRKTQYEEYICRCEDERFELDVVIEANAHTIAVFESVAQNMSRMSADELMQFQLDDTLGSDSSTTIHQRAVRRIYGDKANEVIEGLKFTPAVAIPLVLKRLKGKDEEWREAQRQFNKVWSEQVERFYLKSLDHQGMSFKQSDIRALRSKSLISEIETIFDERNEAPHPTDDPHLSLVYKERPVLDDACNLLLHHVRRQSSIQKDDKKKIKQLLKHFIPDIFRHTRMDLSDDENDASHDEQEDRRTPTEFLNGTRNGGKRGTAKRGNGKKKDDDAKERNKSGAGGSGYNANSAKGGTDQFESRRAIFKRELKQTQIENSRLRTRAPSVGKDNIRSSRDGNSDYSKSPEEESSYTRMIHIPHPDQDESYTLFFVNNAFYVFLRLHHILCERLTRILDTCTKLLANETPESRENAMNSAAVNLRMRIQPEIDYDDFYPSFLDMVRNLLDGVIDAGTYEDSLREMFGIDAFIAFTMDKVIVNAVRQLQTLVSDEVCQKCLDLYTQASRNGGAGGLCATSQQRLSAEITYQKQAEKAFVDENCFKVILYHKSCQMTMTMIETDTEKESTQDLTKWNTYIENYSKPETGDLRAREKIKPVFLRRNLRKRREPTSPSDSSAADTPDVRKHPKGENIARLDPVAVSQKETEYLESIMDLNVKKRTERKEQPDKRGKEKGRDSDEPAETYGPCSISAVSPEEAEFLDENLRSTEARRNKMETDIAAAIAASNYIVKDELQCTFNTNSYKMLYVVNSENYFYFKGALKRAKDNHKKVSNKLNENFGKWHQAWLESNVTEDQIMRCEDWFMSVKNSDTRVVSNNDIKLAPYRPINKFIVWKGTSTRHP